MAKVKRRLSWALLERAEADLEAVQRDHVREQGELHAKIKELEASLRETALRSDAHRRHGEDFERRWRKVVGELDTEKVARKTEAADAMRAEQVALAERDLVLWHLQAFQAEWEAGRVKVTTPWLMAALVGGSMLAAMAFMFGRRKRSSPLEGLAKAPEESLGSKIAGYSVGPVPAPGSPSQGVPVTPVEASAAASAWTSSEARAVAPAEK